MHLVERFADWAVSFRDKPLEKEVIVVQSRGTAHIGKIFGPVMVVWFLTLAVLGIGGIHALNAMGISPAVAFDIEKRPFYATEDGKGKPVEAVFA